MSDISFEAMSKQEFVQYQINQTVEQELAGVTVRMALMTCRCGWRRPVVMMYKCLYCSEWMCHACAEVHFGKTVEQYREENPKIAP